MTTISTEEVKRIAHLSRLNISEQDIPAFAEKLGKILSLVEKMNSADTDGISPLAHPLDLAQRLRPDVVSESDQHELFQSIAPKVDMGLYLVPQVIAED